MPTHLGFFTAVHDGDLESARAALDNDVLVDTRDAYGATALMYACDRGDEAMVRLLIAHGASPVMRVREQSALRIAYSRGHASLFRVLVTRLAKL